MSSIIPEGIIQKKEFVTAVMILSIAHNIILTKSKESILNMGDLFDEVISCKECGRKMARTEIFKNGCRIRALVCEKCGKKIYHPADVEEYKRFASLRQRPFNVKLRIVGNSYTVSIPREIINFQEQMHQEMKKQIERMNKIVRLSLEEPGKISMMFEEEEAEDAN
jgi:hypothetical protein